MYVQKFQEDVMKSHKVSVSLLSYLVQKYEQRAASPAEPAAARRRRLGFIDINIFLILIN